MPIMLKLSLFTVTKASTAGAGFFLILLVFLHLYSSEVWQVDKDHNVWMLSSHFFPHCSCPIVTHRAHEYRTCAALAVTADATGLGCLSVCLSFPLSILLSIRSWCSCCALGLSVTAEVETVETKCPLMALNNLITCFSGALCIWSSTFTETATTKLQSPLDTFVIRVLLISYHWQRRDEPSENDRLFCFDEKMSSKGNLFNASLPFRLQKVALQ